MTSIVFPGQGSQYVGMGKDFYDNFKVARETFEEIQDYVNINLCEIIFNNKDNLLNFTNYTQISIFTTSISIFKTLESESNLKFDKINFMLGHSLGEYSALACSKKLNLKDCSTILKLRGELMNNAVDPNKSGMAALIGCDSSHIQQIIDQNNINLEIANDNSPIQVVISGDIADIENNKDLFIQNGVKKYIPLNVSAAFHSKYMKNAQNILSKEIDILNFNKNNIKIISNYSGKISEDINEIKNSLKLQMANKVNWTKSIISLSESQENEIIEIGPNKVLSGLIKRISNTFDIKSITNINDLKVYDT